MRTPSKTKTGIWKLVVENDGIRRHVTIGRVSRRDVEAFCRNLERLIDHAKYGSKSLPPELLSWVSDLSDRHKHQLSELGLFSYRKAGLTVGDLLRSYLRDYLVRPDIAGSTKTKVKSTIENRLDKIRNVPIDSVEPAQLATHKNSEPVWSDEAKSILADFNSWQRNHYSAATWTRDNKLLSSIGIWAVNHGFCEFNPFSDLPTASMVNDERNEYVTRENVLDAMEACLSPDTRITLALGRFAGLRTCSEVRTLKWEHVDWENKTLTIIDSKKKSPRIMPLFSDVADELRVQRRATGNTRFVASAELRQNASARNYQMIREAVLRSGQQVWNRLRQNLRSSCENDLLGLFDERLVALWIGHTVAVSRQHYQKMRASDYFNAVEAYSAHNSKQPNCQ